VIEPGDAEGSIVNTTDFRQSTPRRRIDRPCRRRRADDVIELIAYLAVNATAFRPGIAAAEPPRQWSAVGVRPPGECGSSMEAGSDIRSCYCHDSIGCLSAMNNAGMLVDG